jgi:hypothetical protein
VRRSGWFVAGMATAVGVVAAGEVARRRMRGPLDELPPAVGYEHAMSPPPVADEPVSDDPIADPAQPEVESDYVTVSPLRTPPPPDRRSEELRTRIAESRRRMHEKAKAGADGSVGQAGPSGAADDDEEPTEEH